MTIKALIPHLHFDGDAAKAIALYQRALGAEVVARMTWADMPGGGDKVAPSDREKVMHARLQIGKAAMLLNDAMPGGPDTPRTNGTLMLEFDDAAEMGARFDALAQGGRVVMAIHDAFWGAKFGILVDAMGVAWMFHAESPKG